MHRVVISDASCLIALDEIGQLKLLKALFEQIVITPEVELEFGLPVQLATKKFRFSQAIIQKILEESGE